MMLAQDKPLIIDKFPAWMPGALVDKLLKSDTREYTGRLYPAEVEIYRKKKPIKPSLWSEKHRVLTMSSLPGKWKNEVTPYLRGIMDASFFPTVRNIAICKAPQTGVSEAVHNCIGYAIDRAPGPVLYVYPDIVTSKENCTDRIQPMLTSSGRLRTYLTGRDDDLSVFRVNLKHMIIYLAWARSAARLGNKPIKYAVSDETDKYPPTAGKREAGPLELVEKRLTTYKWSSKHWQISTPTIETGPIWKAINECQIVFDYWVKCPDCGGRQLMEFKQIKFDDERDPEKIQNEKIARYECILCLSRWNDDKRNRAVRSGRWQDRKTGKPLFNALKVFRPAKIGFHLPAWLSFFVSLSEVAAAFLKTGKDRLKLRDWKNNFEAVPWIQYEIDRDEDKIFELKDDRPRLIVPGDNQVAALTAGIDTQSNGFWYEVRAWAWGFDLDSWQIREGFVADFEGLKRILFDDVYSDDTGREYPVRMAVIDAMGGVMRLSAGVGTRTAEVYDFCRAFRGRIYPLKGERTLSEPWKLSKLDRYPNGRPMPGSVQLVRAWVTYYKYELDRRLDINIGDPGAWRFHAEVTAEWARQMVAEGVDESGYWINPHERPNHAFDCSVYNLVAADLLGVKAWRKREEKPAPEKTDDAAAEPESTRRRLSRPKKSWLNIYG